MRRQRREVKQPPGVPLTEKQLERVRGGDGPVGGKWYVPELDSGIDDYVDARY